MLGLLGQLGASAAGYPLTLVHESYGGWNGACDLLGLLQSVTHLLAPMCVRACGCVRDVSRRDAMFCPSVAGVLGMLFGTSALATLGFGW